MNLTILNKYFDKVYVLTTADSLDRQKVFRNEFINLEFEFFIGIHKSNVDLDEWESKGWFDQKKAISFSRFNYKMKTAEVACAMGHRMIYQDAIKNNYQRILIFEDDVLFLSQHSDVLESALESMPNDGNIIYFDYVLNEKNNLYTKGKQVFYLFQKVWRGMKFNVRMIFNLYPRKYSKYFNKSGYHYYTDAYAMNLDACKTLIELQSPIQFPADHVLAWAITNDLLKGYISLPKFFEQTSTKLDSKNSLIQMDERKK